MVIEELKQIVDELYNDSNFLNVLEFIKSWSVLTVVHNK